MAKPKVIKTSYSGCRLSETGTVAPFGGIPNDIIVRSDIKYQTHMGFGGAFTDATVDCYAACSEEDRERIIKAYFSKDGLAYNLARLTVHSSDFSSESYTYIKGEDLGTFDLSREDEVKLPMIKRSVEESGGLVFFAAPWSPPAFMKSNKDMCHGGLLLDEYREMWAEYYARYLEEMKKRGIEISYASVQNEPEAIQTWESREVSALEEAYDIRDHLAPAFARHGLDIKFYLWDHNRDRMVRRTIDSMSVEGVAEHVWGVGYHWYCCDRYENLSNLHTLYPELHIILSECCVELAYDSTTGESSSSGLWKHGERYATQIIGDFNNWSEGYIDWNLVLDEGGGPNHAGNFCEAPIMLDGKGGLVFNPSYWYIAHFSRYIAPGARRIFSSGGASAVHQTAYLNPDGTRVLVAMNKSDRDIDTNIDIDGEIVGLTLESHSIVTVLI